MKSKRDEVIGGSILFLFGGITAILSLRMPIGDFRAAGTGMFPLILGVLLMVLSGLFVAQRLRDRTVTGAEKKEAETPVSVKQLLMFLGVTVAAVAGFTTMGFPLMSFLLMLLLLRSLGIKGWAFLLSVSLLTAASSYALFVYLLKIPLPKGLVGI
jgi:putative tricarboxylic transport membrane protein